MNVAARHGFFFHHALHSQNYVLMVLWMDTKTGCRIPHFAHHYCGIGGIVLKLAEPSGEGAAESNASLEVALIKEHRSDQPDKWKLPGGFIDPSEKIQDAAVREVREETGIHAEFIGIVGMRENAVFKYGASDIYFGSILFNKSTEIAIEDTREVKQA